MLNLKECSQKRWGLIYFGWLFLLLTSFQGISYRHFSLPHSVSVFVVEVDPQQYLILPVHAYGQAIGRQTVKEIADEYQAIAAINGGFFKYKPFEGLPAGILKIHHQWFGWPTKPRGAIGWSHDGNIVLFDRLLCQGSLTILNQNFPIQGLNRPPQESETILFTPAFHATTLTPSKGFEVIIRQNRFLSVHEGGNSSILPDSYVLSFGSKQQLPFWKRIQRGTPIHLNLQTLPQISPGLAYEWNRLPHIVGGTPLLVHQGQVISDFSPEKTLNTFLDCSHVRSAVGLLKNGHWIFVVVEGKQWSKNRGMTIPDLANLMIQLGCYEALNLDGGGSSTLVFESRIVNHPTGDEDEKLGAETARSVSDAILVIPNSSCAPRR